jgi:macrolide transport system ATP-binding/permease protein
MLERLNRSGITVILVTHEADIAAHARRIIKIKDGRIFSDERTGASVGAPVPSPIGPTPPPPAGFGWPKLKSMPPRRSAPWGRTKPEAPCPFWAF